MEKKEFDNKVGKIFGLKEGEALAVTVLSFADTGNIDVHMRITKDSLKTKKVKMVVKESWNNLS